MTEARVWKGERESTGLGTQRDVYVTIPRGSYDRLEAELDLPQQLVAPVAPTDELGVLRVSLADQTLAEAGLFALNGVAEGSIWQQARDSVLLWFE